MYEERSFQFTHAILCAPAVSCVDGLRSDMQLVPDVDRFRDQHLGYERALREAGVETIVLPALEQYPDSVFVEDAALCFAGMAVVLRPGAASRAGEAGALAPHLESVFEGRVERIDHGSIDGGDILLTNDEVYIGLSARTDRQGAHALRPHLEARGYAVRIVNTPEDVLHFKSHCSLLDAGTILATARLSACGCFNPNLRVIETPPGEEAAANLVRVNDYVILADGFPRTRALLVERGYQVVTIDISEAARLDGGLSCMSLRFCLE